MEEKFNYCIAREWESNTEALNVYTYGSQVKYGTRGEAEEFLEYVEEATGEKYKIYKLIEA
jgi:hypothetical protein